METKTKPLTPQQINAILSQGTLYIDGKEFGTIGPVEIDFRDFVKGATSHGFIKLPHEVFKISGVIKFPPK